MIIKTHSGQYLNPLEPESEPLISDIAHALSKLCRYNGHCASFYSVAEHSVIVSDLCSDDDALGGLLHDAAEAYIGDLTSPLKQHLPEFRAIESKVQNWINDHFGVDTYRPDIKRADLQALSVEKDVLFVKHPDDEKYWGNLPKPTVEVNPSCMGCDSAAKLFIRVYQELTGGDPNETIWPGDFHGGELVDVEGVDMFDGAGGSVLNRPRTFYAGMVPVGINNVEYWFRPINLARRIH